MLEPHKGNLSEIDFYRQNLTRQEYLEELRFRSSESKTFFYKGKCIAVAGVCVADGYYTSYWQFLTEDFPKDYIPQSFIKEFIRYGDRVLRTYGKTIVTIFDENTFAKWLIHYGKKSGWKVKEIAYNTDPDRVTYLVDAGGD